MTHNCAARCLAGNVEEMGEGPVHVLRARSTREPAATASPEARCNTLVQRRAEKVRALFDLAESLGFACLPLEKLLQEVATAISTRMRTRLGRHIYQSVSHMLPGIPLAVAMEIFPSELLAEQINKQTHTWVFPSMESMVEPDGAPVQAAG